MEPIDLRRDPGIPGMRLGLESMRRLLHQLGNPDRTIPRIVHITGTNGKGSVATMLAAIFAAAGLSTVLYTSPHFHEARESYFFNGGMMPEADFEELAAEAQKAAAVVGRRYGQAPTTFEALTAIAYLWCRQLGADVLIQEVGLGGRLDATNAVHRTHLSVITTVSVDHAPWLGDTPAAVAREKAGILRPGVPVVTAATGDALAVIKERARQLRAPVITAGWNGQGAGADYTVEYVTTSLRGGTAFSLRITGSDNVVLSTRLLGRHQALNAATAVAAARSFPLPCGKDSAGMVGWGAIQRGLDKAMLPGRLELLGTNPTLFIDGAHNPDGMARLRESLAELVPGAPLILVCGMMADKDLRASAEVWSGSGAGVYVVPVPSSRSSDPQELARHFSAAGLTRVEVAPTWQAGLARARETAGRDAAVICVCGSLHLALAVRSELSPGHAYFT